jgi:hypothetical protein
MSSSQLAQKYRVALSPSKIVIPSEAKDPLYACDITNLDVNMSVASHYDCHPERSEATAERSRRTLRLPATQRTSTPFPPPRTKRD